MELSHRRQVIYLKDHQFNYQDDIKVSEVIRGCCKAKNYLSGAPLPA